MMATLRDSRALTVALAVLGVAAAASVGYAATLGVTGAVALATLLPLVSHVRWVGPRRAFSEPSAVTIVLVFYLFIFPLRGLAMAASNYEHLEYILRGVTPSEVANALLLASLATTLFVEAFHLARRSREPEPRPASAAPAEGTALTSLALLLGAIAVASLALIIVGSNGLRGAQETYLSHSKTEAAEARSFAGSLWQTLSVPALWCAAFVALNRRESQSIRLMLVGCAFVIAGATLLVFGSRLNLLLALMGVWAIYHHSRRAISPLVILAAIPVIILVSIPIVKQRSGGDVFSVGTYGLSTYERYSRLTSYSVLEASLAVRQQPEELRERLTNPDRWLRLPGYLVPSALWPGKPDFEQQRLDGLVARTFGTRNQSDSGYPTGFMTEVWMYGGWPLALLVAALAGALAGWLHRRLVGAWAAHASGAALIAHCFVLTAAFSYYKDGDILMNVVSVTRAGIYLGVAMALTGAWTLWRRTHPPRAAVAPRSGVSPTVGWRG